ncbi:LysM domain-containing protein [Curtobacterium sp. MCBD17_021]|uniref:LysM domain-containing protein n=1 Tax=Curtobacterium sp. MCBD17_021 TaxID=2175665 RepID=UPI0011B529DB|nr:LysM domain-containing protein [Curtobacterium sp. MCBD17_021]
MRGTRETMHQGDAGRGRPDRPRRARPRPGRLLGALVLATVVVTTAAGCAFLRGPDELPAPSRSATADRSGPAPDPSVSAEARRIAESASPRTPTAVPTEAAAPDPTVSPIPVGTVISEADVVTPKGSVRFHYRVVVADDGYPTVQWSGFSSTLPVPVGTTFLETPPSVGDGLTWHGVGDTVLGGGSPAAPAPTTTDMDPGRVDPSWLGTLVVYSAAESAGPDLPVELGPDKVLAVAPVRWSVPARTTNVHPVDGGARPNATGTTSSEGSADGSPTAYRIASEDLIGAVADRLGLTVKDLVWLNPDVTVYGDQQYLYEDTVLNLDPFRR